MSDKTNSQIAEEIVKGVCLIPRKEALEKDSWLTVSHETPLNCCCDIKKKITKALDEKDAKWRDQIRERESLD